MKYSIFFFTVLFLASCNSSELELLKEANEELKTENVVLKTIMENSFMMPFDSIGQYMMSVTCGANELSVGEEGEFRTFIAWPKFPDGMQFDWKINKGEGILKNTDPEEAYKIVSYSYKEKGEYEIYGTYNLTLPNGVVRDLMWLKPTTVK